MALIFLFKVTNATRVCSAHFLPSDFDKKLSGIRRRKPGAVPSVFSWTKDTPKRRSPQKRLCRKYEQIYFFGEKKNVEYFFIQAVLELPI